MLYPTLVECLTAARWATCRPVHFSWRAIELSNVPTGTCALNVRKTLFFIYQYCMLKTVLTVRPLEGNRRLAEAHLDPG